MTVYSFSNIHFSLQGGTSAAEIAIEAMFKLAPRNQCSTPIPLHAYLVNESDPFEMLPEWLSGKISALPPSSEIYMYYGPDGDMATVAKNIDTLSCVWLSPGHDELRFVSQKNSAIRAGLSVACVLVPVLREALQRHKKLLLHAASVRCNDGTGVLIQADGGGGKSTSALAMLRDGATLLADDLVILNGSPEGRKRLTGFPEYLNLTDKTIEFFPEIADVCDDHPMKAYDEELKACFDPRRLYPQAFSVDEVPLQAIYFIQIAPDGPEAIRLAPPETLSRLIKSHTFALQQKMDSAMASTLIEVAHSIPAYVVRTGPSPAELGKWLNRNSRRLATGDAHTCSVNDTAGAA